MAPKDSIREQLRHGETGWIVENNEEALYEGLKRLLQNPDLRERVRSGEGMEALCRNEVKYDQFYKLCSAKE